MRKHWELNRDPPQAPEGRHNSHVVIPSTAEGSGVSRVSFPAVILSAAKNLSFYSTTCPARSNQTIYPERDRVRFLFLELNGYRFTASEETAAQAIMELASGNLDESGYAAFLRANLARQKK